MDVDCRKGKHAFVCEVLADEQVEDDNISTDDNEVVDAEDESEVKPPTDVEEPLSEDEEEEVVVTACKEGWHAYGSSCYFIGHEKKKNNDARLFCKKHGATLASIEDQAENQAVFALLGKKYVFCTK